MEVAVNLIQDEAVDQIAIVFRYFGGGLRDAQFLHHFGRWSFDRGAANDR